MIAELKFGECKLNSLLYADDMVLIAKNEQVLENFLCTLNTWATKWRVKINCLKSKVINIRNPRNIRTEHAFSLNRICSETVKIVFTYQKSAVLTTILRNRSERKLQYDRENGNNDLQ